MLVGAPIINKKFLKVDYLANLSVFHPKEFTTPHLDLHAHLGYRGKTPTYAQVIGNECSEETWDIRAFGWCPGSVVLRLQFQLRILYEQPEHEVPI